MSLLQSCRQNKRLYSGIDSGKKITAIFSVGTNSFERVHERRQTFTRLRHLILLLLNYPLSSTNAMKSLTFYLTDKLKVGS